MYELKKIIQRCFIVQIVIAMAIFFLLKWSFYWYYKKLENMFRYSSRFKVLLQSILFEV